MPKYSTWTKIYCFAFQNNSSRQISTSIAAAVGINEFFFRNERYLSYLNCQSNSGRNLAGILIERSGPKLATFWQEIPKFWRRNLTSSKTLQNPFNLFKISNQRHFLTTHALSGRICINRKFDIEFDIEFRRNSFLSNSFLTPNLYPNLYSVVPKVSRMYSKLYSKLYSESILIILDEPWFVFLNSKITSFNL